MRLSLIFLLLLSACGYRYEGGEKIAISVPYVIGDYEGQLTTALIQALADTPNFRYASNGADWMLKAKILKTDNDRIGYRYDWDDVKREEKIDEEEVRTWTEYKRKDNLVGVENRKDISLEVQLIDCCSGKTVIGPQIVKMDVDYDYVNPTDPQDVAFFNPISGKTRSSIMFSLGQLDSVGAAGEEALSPLYRKLAQRVVDGLIASGGLCDVCTD